MTHQSELQLENELLAQLGSMGYERVTLVDSDALLENLRSKLGEFNEIVLSVTEFKKILNHLNKGDRFQKAKALRDRFLLHRDDGKEIYIRFFNTTQWCKNVYQVSSQISQTGSYANRYDVTILINGLPLVQIELKRRGVEMKEAFNQIRRYHRHSFAGTLFEFIQIFVISNGVNTKYFANNPKQSFEQSFFWTDSENRKVTRLSDFTDTFLEKCFLSEMISEHTVLAETNEIMMILRPYQYYAVKVIEKRVKESNKNGYIWHTTGSGKTLTSFKASQVLAKEADIKKILFVVDRKDLDVQTTQEFNSFSKGSVDSTTRTKVLADQLEDKNRKLIVTTIQKLDRAISKEHYLSKIDYLKREKVVLIFDECHRSQFGTVHGKIKSFFENSQMIGFTGTPIFADNHVGGVTTKDVFEECLHKYIITHAIDDKNVLGFAIEYVGKYKYKDQYTLDADIFADALVKGIDTKEVLESDDRLSKITNYILADWKRKTKRGMFNALFATPSIDVLKKYYKLFKERKPEDFKIATVFTYKANEEENPDTLDDDINVDLTGMDQHSRDFLEDCIRDYNKMFGTNYSTDTFAKYFENLQKRIKSKEVDLVIVVNMLLTGFDAKRLNTLYVDKNLRYHGLIQAYSRTNRLLDSTKPHGNIVSFRNLKEETDKALALFGDENAKEIVFKKPYELQKADFESKIEELKRITPEVSAVDLLQGEHDKAKFVKTFRDLLRIKASLETFAEFSFADFNMTEQEFYDYQSKYLDVYDSNSKADSMKESVLDEIDFELELTVRDVVDFDYIILLIAGLKDISSTVVREKKEEEILKLFDRDIHLRKKKELIRQFIEENLPKIQSSGEVENAFSEFWDEKRQHLLKEMSANEEIPYEKLEKVIGQYIYSQKLPQDQEIAELFEKKINIRERSTIIDRVKNAIANIVEVFEW